jgi:ribosomal protein S18 acetylase RimI-like enzyme
MIEVRKAIKDDIFELATMNHEFNEANVAREHIIDSLENSKEIVVVAVCEKQIIGFACGQYFKSFCYEDLVGEITELYVREQFRRKGAATSLICFLEKELNSIGAKEVKIITNVKNEAAKSIYDMLGYKLKNWVVLNKKY